MSTQPYANHTTPLSLRFLSLILYLVANNAQRVGRDAIDAVTCPWRWNLHSERRRSKIDRKGKGTVALHTRTILVCFYFRETGMCSI
jgi:hypothetical protein